MSMIIGLTGPTGAGKSLFTEIAARQGCCIINCDSSARKAAYKGSAMLRELAAHFGDYIIDADGELDRKALAEKAFKNRRSTELLDKISLPYIAKFIRGEIDAAVSSNDVILLDAPTLYESGLDTVCDTVIAVLSDEKVRLERILERDGITIEQATLRMNAGKDEEFYTSKAEHIIYNNSDVDGFFENAEKLLKKIIGGKKV